MDYIKKNKNKIISRLLITSLILLAVRLTFFLQDRTSELVELILIILIVLISIVVIVLFILPTKISIFDFFRKYFDMFLLAIYIFIYEFLFIFENKLELTSIIFFSIAFAVSIFVCILLMLPRKLKSIVIISFIVIITIYVLGQDIYYEIFGDFFSFKEIVSLQAGLEFTGGVVKFKFPHYVFVILSLTTLILYIKFNRDNQIKICKKNNRLFILPLFLFVLVNVNAQYPPKSARLYLSDHYLYQSVYSNKKFIPSFGFLNFFARDFFDAIIPEIVSKKDIDYINKFFLDNMKNHEDNEFSGIFEDKNLVFIVVESLDYMAINEELTPNLVKLMNEGINFENHYVPVYPRTTCDSEIIYNTSIIPSVKDGPTCYMFNENTYTNSLANLFNNKGYNTSAFHSNYKEFYTRYKVYEGLGYDQFYGQNEIGLSEIEKRYDSLFFEKGKDLMIREDGKFLSSIVTLSGHSPYNMDNLAVERHYDAVDNYYGDSISKEVKAYIAAQMETDLFVEEVLADLEEKNLIDDTIIVLTSDHYPYTMDTETYEKHTGIKDEYLKNKAPLVIWGNGIEHQTVDKLSSSFDVLPTIANMFNLDVDYTFYFGNDVFSDDYTPIVYYKDFSWFDEDGNYVLYGKLQDGTADGEYIDNMTQMIDEYFNVAQKILKVDYFKEYRSFQNFS